jgi:ElaB/YqjD/DUF883 family membrane-anchored ribosome-binding protein
MEFALLLAFSNGGTMTPNQPGYESTTNDIRDFRGESQEAMDAAKRQLTDVIDTVSERAREYGRYADEQVQQKPWTAVGVGFGVGVVMGALLMLASRR